MSELLFAFGIAIAFITLIGHALWLGFAWFFRLLKGAIHPPESRSPAHQTPTALPVTRSTMQQQRMLVLRILDALWRAGRISDAAMREVRTALEQAASSAAVPSGPPPSAEEQVVIQAEVQRPERQPPSPRPEEPVPEVEAIRPQHAPRPEEAIHRRAEAFIQKAAQAAEAERQAAAVAPPTPQAPRRTVAELLAGFMEEKNIRWGELVGGLLIISCSAALVVSFWSTIAERVFLKYFVFNGVNAFLFAVGFYAAQRWRLPTTSTGVLLIAGMLTPLNFLALSSFSKDGTAPTNIILAGELVSLIGFAALTYYSARILWPKSAIPYVIGIMVPAGMELLIRRWIDPQAPLSTMYAVGLIVVAALLIANAWTLWNVRRDEAFGEPQFHELLQVLGVTSFAALLACGAMVVKTQRIGVVAHQLAPLLSLIALPPLAAGISIWKRSRATDAVTRSTVGAGLGIAGAITMFAALLLAWPIPLVMILTALASGAALTALALLLPLAEAHVPAVFGFAAALIVAFPCQRGELDWWSTDARSAFESLVSAASGMRLIAAMVVAAMGAGAWRQLRRRRDAGAYLAASAGLGVVSLVLVTVFGFGRAGDPHQVFFAYAIFASGAAAAAFWSARADVVWCASLLVLMACVQGCVFRWTQPELWATSWPTALLMHASLVAIASVVCRERAVPALRAFDGALTSNALITGAAALVWMSGFALNGHTALSPALLGWAALVCLAVSWSADSAWLFTCFHAITSVALAVWADRLCQPAPWYQATPWPRLQPAFLLFQAMIQGWLGLFWIVVRLAFVHWIPSTSAEGEQVGIGQRWRSLLFPKWISFDRLAVGLAVITVLLSSIYSVAPGVAQELTPRGLVLGTSDPGVVAESSAVARGGPPLQQLEFTGIPHAPGLSWRGWAAVGLMLVVLAVGSFEQVTRWRIDGMALMILAAVMLAAGRWESETAAASALRWGLSGFFAAASAAYWFLPRWSIAARWFPPLRSSARVPRGYVFGLLTLSTLAPLIGMAVYVGSGALWLGPPDVVSGSILRGLFVLSAISGGIALAAFTLERLGAVVGGVAAPWKPIGWTILVLGLMPLAAMVLFVIGQSLAQHPILGPDPTSVFTRMGLAASYAIPMCLIALTLVGHAVFLHSESVALAAGLAINLSTTAAYLLTFRGSAQFSAEQWFKLAQLNALAAAVFGLAWASYYWKRGTRQTTGLLVAQHSIASGFLAAALLACIQLLFVEPTTSIRLQTMGDVWGWLAWAATAVAAFWCARVLQGSARWRVLYGFGFAAALLLALLAHASDGGLRWRAFHGVILAALTVAGLVLAVDWRLLLRSRFTTDASDAADAAADTRPLPVGLFTLLGLNWSRGGLLIAVLFGLRAGFADPARPWWSVGAWTGAAILLTAIAAGSCWGVHLFWAAVLLNLSASCWWVVKAAAGGHALDFIYLNLAVATLPAALWLAVDRYIARQVPTEPWRRPRVHRWASGSTIVVLSLLSLISLWANVWSRPLPVTWLYQWTALIAAMTAATICLWDERARWAGAGLYFVGLVMATAVVNSFDIPARLLLWTLTLVLAAYAVAASYLWSRREGVIAWCARMRFPLRREHLDHVWLPLANLNLTVIVVVMAFWGLFTCHIGPLRFALAQAVLAQTAAVGMLARGRAETQLRYTALCIGVLGAVALSWSWLTVSDWQALHRLAMASAAIAATAALYGFGLVKLLPGETNPWTQAAQRLTPTLGGLSIALVLTVVGLETVAYFGAFGERPAPWAIALVSLTLIVVCVLCLLASVVPGRDPFNLSERGRMAYVYAAEAALALLFLHLRVAVPEWFSGVFARYWPMIMMLVAFVGVGLGEWFRRRQTNVLAAPLERTGVLLPILPVLGYWAAPPPVAAPALNYSGLMVTVGLMYAGMSLLRKSFAYGALSVAAVNIGFWALLYGSENLGFLRHPQVWLIPPALCILGAAYLHRERLSMQQMTAMRYFSGIIVYVSSTADVFLNGVAQAPWLPLVLAGLALVGVFAGILLHVRAFLYLGISFLALALLTMIWYAAVDLRQTWIWYVCGIIAGVAIIALFAIFEKKRNEIHLAMERFKQWEP